MHQSQEEFILKTQFNKPKPELNRNKDNKDSKDNNNNNKQTPFSASSLHGLTSVQQTSVSRARQALRGIKSSNSCDDLMYGICFFQIKPAELHRIINIGANALAMTTNQPVIAQVQAEQQRAMWHGGFHTVFWVLVYINGCPLLRALIQEHSNPTLFRAYCLELEREFERHITGKYLDSGSSNEEEEAEGLEEYEAMQKPFVSSPAKSKSSASGKNKKAKSQGKRCYASSTAFCFEMMRLYLHL